MPRCYICTIILQGSSPSDMGGQNEILDKGTTK